MWKPQMEFSKDQDAIIKHYENREFEIEFTVENNAYCKRVKTYKNNLVMAYALLSEQCTKAIKNKIEARSDYLKIKNNPILL
jgi:hypothetical protein